ncbi:MAG: pyridoxamine 5'-phosphate oxidase family protein [Pseudomonadota bacterium]
MITDFAKQMIETWRLGFIATADADGNVNLSPKGTFVVLDEKTFGFAEMRSPNTLANIATRPLVEVNFFDILARKAARLRGMATTIDRGTEKFEKLLPQFAPLWPDLANRFNAIVTIEAQTCQPITSPAYDAGAKEEDLRQIWCGKIAELCQC